MSRSFGEGRAGLPEEGPVSQGWRERVHVGTCGPRAAATRSSPSSRRAKPKGPGSNRDEILSGPARLTSIQRDCHCEARLRTRLWRIHGSFWLATRVVGTGSGCSGTGVKGLARGWLASSAGATRSPAVTSRWGQRVSLRAIGTAPRLLTHQRGPGIFRDGRQQVLVPVFRHRIVQFRQMHGPRGRVTVQPSLLPVPPTRAVEAGDDQGCHASASRKGRGIAGEDGREPVTAQRMCKAVMGRGSAGFVLRGDGGG